MLADSGCDSTMVQNGALLRHLRPSSAQVQVASGMHTPAAAEGVLEGIVLTHTGQQRVVSLPALHVPGLARDTALFSTSSLWPEGGGIESVGSVHRLRLGDGTHVPLQQEGKALFLCIYAGALPPATYASVAAAGPHFPRLPPPPFPPYTSP